jgi:hypothetical protein
MNIFRKAITCICVAGALVCATGADAKAPNATFMKCDSEGSNCKPFDLMKSLLASRSSKARLLCVDVGERCSQNSDCCSDDCGFSDSCAGNCCYPE